MGTVGRAVHRNVTKAQFTLTAIGRLHEKQREVGGTPCQEHPSAWDAPSRASQEAYETAAWAAERCVAECKAFEECDRFLETAPDMKGVIAGRLVGFPKPPGRPAWRKNEEQEND